MTAEHIDVLIVGAGISGIGAAYHIQTRCPGKSIAILEAREAIGGTWDLFRYPGIRSDSDMYTFGYAFRPWSDPKAIADADSIIAYLKETTEAYGIDKKIRFRRKVVSAAWSTPESRWTLMVRNEETGETVAMTCQFLFMCTGYYDYAEGYQPDFPGLEQYRGTFVHPQKWPEDLDYTGKRVVVIGSGATAITLVPAMAETAGHVTMLQRSPSYVVARPNDGALVNALRRFLPDRMAFGMIRWLHIFLSLYFFRHARKNPEAAKKFVLDGVRKELGPDFDIETHFTPSYNVWDQRLCLTPDGDFFQAIREGKADIVTDHIQSFTETGIALRSGAELKADIVVSATGLKVQLLSDVAFSIDGRPIDPSQSLQYRGVMFSDIPNLAWTIGYTNASWTLKADLTAEYVCRVMNYMDRKGYTMCMPKVTDPTVEPEEIIDFSSGYILRAQNVLPKQGNKVPWQLHQNYLYDVFLLRYGKLDDEAMSYA